MKASRPYHSRRHTTQALACVPRGRVPATRCCRSERRSPLGALVAPLPGPLRLAGQSVRGVRRDARVGALAGRGHRPPADGAFVRPDEAGRAQWEAVGVTVGCATDDLLAAAFDKSQTIERARACGVSTPPTRVPASLAECGLAAEEVGFPCVVKPRRSNHWDGRSFLPTRGPAYVGRREELAGAAESLRQGDDWPLVQGYVSGRGKGVFALCDGGRAVAWFAHERLRDTRHRVGQLPAPLRRARRASARAGRATAERAALARPGDG